MVLPIHTSVGAVLDHTDDLIGAIFAGIGEAEAVADGVACAEGLLDDSGGSVTPGLALGYSPFLHPGANSIRVPTARTCVVDFTGSEGIRHNVEVTASTLYEAAALAINVFCAVGSRAMRLDRRCGSP